MYMLVKRIFLDVLLLSMMTAFGVSNLYADSVFSVGNSLTNDMVPDYVPVLANDSGEQLTADYHLRSSASMTYMTSNPDDVTFFRPEKWNNALIDHAYSFVTLEPHLGFDQSTLASESNAIVAVVNTALSGASRHATFFLYVAWPSQDDTGGDYHSYWLRDASGEDTQPTTQTRKYYDRLLTRLNDQFKGTVSFRVIPVGDVFDRVDQDSRAGKLTGLNNLSACYRDTIHMGDVGHYVAAATLLASIYQHRPTAGLAVSYYQFGQGDARLTPELANQLLDLVWSVVANDARTRGVDQNSNSSSSSSSAASSSATSSSSSSSVGQGTSSAGSSTISTGGGGSLTLAEIMLMTALAMLKLRSTRAIRRHRSHTT